MVGGGSGRGGGGTEWGGVWACGRVGVLACGCECGRHVCVCMCGGVCVCVCVRVCECVRG